MKKQLAICAGLLVLGIASAQIGAAQAQGIYASPGPFEPSAVLPPYEIMSIVRSTGLAPVTRPMRRGAYYVLVAVDRVGRQMRVVVDAQLGDIVNMRPAMAAGPFGPETAPSPDTASSNAAYAARPSPDNAGPNSGSPLPPRPISSTRAVAPPPASAPVSAGPTSTGAQSTSPPSTSAAPQTRLAVAEPALPPAPPLPRPRPKLALNNAEPATPAAAVPASPFVAKPGPAPGQPSATPDAQIE
jgi:hypothetical protein